MMRLRGDSAKRYKDLSLISSSHIWGQTREHALTKSHCVEGRDRPIPATCWPASLAQSASPRCQWGTVSQKTSCTYPSWGIISDGGFQPTHTHAHAHTNMSTHTHVSDDRRYGGKNAIWHYTIRGDLTNTGPVMSEHRPWVKHWTPGWGAFSGQMQMPQPASQL